MSEKRDGTLLIHTNLTRCSHHTHKQKGQSGGGERKIWRALNGERERE